MTDHAKYEEQICALLDGELSEGEEAELRAHLNECEECRAFLAAMQAVYGASARDLPEAPGTLVSDVMAKVRAEAGAKKRGKVVRFPLKSLAAAAAAALVLWAGARSLPMFRAKSAAPAAESAGMTSAVSADAVSAEPEAKAAGAAVAGETGGAVLFSAESREEAPEAAAAPEEIAENESFMAPQAPAPANARDAGAPAEITIRGTQVLLDGEDVTLDELAAHLEEMTDVSLVCDGADDGTETAVRELLAERNIQVILDKPADTGE